MKIVQVAARFYPFIGGLENYCYGLSKKLVKRGHDVEVITSLLDKKLPLNEVKEGVKITRCLCLGDFFHINPLTFIINKLVKAEPDIIHAHAYIFLTSFQVSLARKFLDLKPYLLHLHGGIDITSPSDDLSTRLKILIKNNFYDKTIGKWTIKSADLVASVSRRDMELAEKIWGIDKQRLFWLPNALDPNEFSNDGHEDSLNVVFIGRLEAWKGLSTLLKVAKIIGRERDDVKFTIIGDGSMRSYVEREASRLGNIDVLGFVKREIIKRVLSNASVFVLPSYCMEGLPTVCLEAMSSEVPIVASRVGGVPEIVIDNKTGYLFSPGNVKLCADRILQLLADERLRRIMGKNGRKLVEKSYSWDNVVNNTENIYMRN